MDDIFGKRNVLPNRLREPGRAEVRFGLPEVKTSIVNTTAEIFRRAHAAPQPCGRPEAHRISGARRVELSPCIPQGTLHPAGLISPQDLSEHSGDRVEH
jgi:hypothetical protein